MKRHADNRKAFTLIEILLVIVILGLLATVAVVTLSGTREGAMEDTTKLKIEEIMQVLEVYYAHVSAYPTEEEGLPALVTKPEFEDEAVGKKWRGPYLKKKGIPKDAWGNGLVYRVVEDEVTGRKKPRIYSFGPNKNDDSGDGDDIKNEAWAEEDVEGE